MTVLGNIVAVTSIIAVVSLIQGLNASVKDAILNQAGADSFSIQQFPITTQRRGVREGPQQPAHHAARRRARSGATTRAGRRGDGRLGRPAAASPTATSRSTTTQIHGVTAEYVNFSSFDAERGRLMSPTEVDTRAAGRRHRLADRRSAVRHEHRSAREDHPDRRRALPRRRRQRQERGSVLGQSQDEFAVIPLGQFQMIFGSRRSAVADA